MYRRWRRVILAVALGASTIPLSTANAKDPAPEKTPTLREKLVAAYFAAPVVHRAYLMRAGVTEFRVEIFRSGVRHGVRIDEGGDQHWMVTKGKELVVTSKEGSDAAEVTRVARLERQRENFKAAIHAVCARWDMPDPPAPAFRTIFSIRVVPAEEPSQKMHMGVSMLWGEDIEPDWLREGVLTVDPMPQTGTLATATVRGDSGHIHIDDGCLADVRGTNPKTGEEWFIREQATTLPEAAWIQHIDDLCVRGASLTQDDDLDAGLAVHFLAAGIGGVASLGPPQREPIAFWRAALCALTNCAWQSPAANRRSRRFVETSREALRIATNGHPTEKQSAEARQLALNRAVQEAWGPTAEQLEAVYGGRAIAEAARESTNAWLKNYLERWIGEAIDEKWRN